MTVWLESGRQFTAEVDSRTDAKHLWLRFEGRATVLRRPIQWARISAAKYQGEEVALADFSQLAMDLAEKTDDHGKWSTALPPSPDSTHSTFAGLAHGALADSPQVSSIEVDAFAANWDRDVETDGIVVRVTALDRQGRSVRVDGSLEVELVASRPVAMTTRGYARGRDLGPAFVRIGRWTRKLESTTHPDGVAEFRLPFRAASPDVDLDLGSLGTRYGPSWPWPDREYFRPVTIISACDSSARFAVSSNDATASGSFQSSGSTDTNSANRPRPAEFQSD